jgi:dimethylhistidine N-methyltransferase
MMTTCPAGRPFVDSTGDDFASDVRDGLAARPKRIPSKYFYDARGSALFERICGLPEYYLTRTELEILRGCAGEIAAAIGPEPLVVEYGSGSGLKTRLLLDALDAPAAYMPIEIAQGALDASVEALSRRFPTIEMLPMCADFTAPLRLRSAQRRHRRIVMFFPGSTLGNFETRDAVGLMRNMHAEMGGDGAAIIGIDLRKDRATIEAAYNDSAGVTRDFTLNLLLRMNRELGADFDVARFRHRAVYNEMAGRIETHIVSRIAQQVRVDGYRVAFGADEPMLVEYSYKYAQDEFARMAARAGLRVVRDWSDPARLFSIQLLQRA